MGMKRLYICTLTFVFILCFAVTGCSNGSLPKSSVPQTNDTQNSADTINGLKNFIYGDWYAEKLIAYNFNTNENEPTPDYRNIVGRTIHIGEDSLISDFNINENLDIEKPIFTFKKEDTEQFLIQQMDVDSKSQKNFDINASDTVYFVNMKSEDGKDKPGYFLIINGNRFILHYMNSFFELKRAND